MGLERLLAVIRAWEEHETVYAKVVRGAMWRMQRESDEGVGVALVGKYSGEANERVHGTWLGQLWAWASSQKVGLRLQGIRREGRPDDVSSTKPLVELFAGKRERREVAEGCRRFGVTRKADLLQLGCWEWRRGRRRQR